MKTCRVKREQISRGPNSHSFICDHPQAGGEGTDYCYTSVPDSEQKKLVLDCMAFAKEPPRKDQKHDYQAKRHAAENTSGNIIYQETGAREAGINPAVSLNILNAQSVKSQSDCPSTPPSAPMDRKAGERDKQRDGKNVNANSGAKRDRLEDIALGQDYTTIGCHDDQSNYPKTNSQ